MTAKTRSMKFHLFDIKDQTGKVLLPAGQDVLPRVIAKELAKNGGDFRNTYSSPT